MALKRGQLRCVTNTKNTGFGSCVEEWKQIAGALLYDAPKSFTDEEIAVMAATLRAQASLDNKAGRMFPMHNFVGITDGSEAPVQETFNYGPKAIVRDGDYDWTFQFTDGQNCLQQALRTHNGKRWVLFYDKDFKILGTTKNNLMANIPLHYFYAHPWKPATGSNVAQYMVQFCFQPKYINELRAFVKCDFDPAEIEGLQDVDIIVNSWDQDTGEANITLQTNCGAENLYDTFSAQLAHTNNFSTVDEDGNAITMTSITPVPGNKSFDVVLDTATFPDEGTLTLSGSTVSALVANNVSGYELGSAELEIEGSGS